MSKAERYLGHWLIHRNVLPNLLDKLSEEHVNFRPAEGVMSLGELAVHICTATDMFVSGVKSGFAIPERPSFSSLADVKRIVAEYTEKTKADLAGLTDEQLGAMVEAKFMNMTFPGHVWLGTMIDHEVHHKGQLFTYARAAGVKELPFFIHRG